MTKQVLFLLVTAAFFSCSQPGDTHLGDLRSAERDVNAGMSILSAWNVDSVAAARERVAMRFQDLDWLVADSTLVYTVEDGQLIGNWARVKRFLKDGPTRLTALDKQGELEHTIHIVASAHILRCTIAMGISLHKQPSPTLVSSGPSWAS